MEKDIVVIEMRWPRKSLGLDINQITDALARWMRENGGAKRRARVHTDAGSGRHITISRTPVKKRSSSSLVWR